MAKSDLDHLLVELRPGDHVIIRDTHRNYIEGEAEHREGRWTIKAFGTDIEFAHDRTNGLGPRMQSGVHIAGHTPQLITLGDDHG